MKFSTLLALGAAAIPQVLAYTRLTPGAVAHLAKQASAHRIAIHETAARSLITKRSDSIITDNNVICSPRNVTVTFDLYPNGFAADYFIIFGSAIDTQGTEYDFEATLDPFVSDCSAPGYTYSIDIPASSTVEWVYLAADGSMTPDANGDYTNLNLAAVDEAHQEQPDGSFLLYYTTVAPSTCSRTYIAHDFAGETLTAN